MFSHFLRKVLPFGWRVTTTRPRTVRIGRRVWHLAPDAAAVLGPGGPDLDRWLADGRAEVVKAGPQRTVYRVRLDAGTVYVKNCPLSVTLNVCALAVSALSTTSACEPSGLRNATSSRLPEPNVLESMRTAPGLTNFDAWPST